MRSSEIQNVIGIAPLTPAGTAFNIFKLDKPPLSAPSAAAILGVPGTGRLPRRRFAITCSGYCIPAVDTNFDLSFFSGTDTVYTNNLGIAESGAIAVTAAAPFNFFAKLNLIYSTETGVLNGSKEFLIGGANYGNSGMIYPNVTGLNDANEPVFNVVVGAAFSVANANHKVVLDTFALEA